MQETIVPPIDTVEHVHADTTSKEKDETAASRPTSVHCPASSHSSEHSTVVADNEDVERAQNALNRVITPRRDPVKVPRNQRRGWLARFALLPEVENPYDYSNPVKWFITVHRGSCGCCRSARQLDLLSYVFQDDLMAKQHC